MRLPVVGQAYEHPSQDVNYQRCVNMFVSLSGPEGIGEPACLLPTSGIKSTGGVSDGKTEVRAIMSFNDKLYCAIEDRFYQITFNLDTEVSTFVQRGNLRTSTGRVSWARNLTQIMMVDGSQYGYTHTPEGETFAEITDVDFTGGETVVFMDGYFLYNTPDSVTMFATQIEDGTSVDALDVASAEAHPDKLIALLVDKRELWAFGPRSIEIWYDAANPNGFPFSRREGAHVDLGCGARHSAINIDNTMMWLDDRGFIVKANAYTPEPVSTEAITKEIRSYKVTEDAIAFQYTDRGHLFYVISFPTADKTWAYDLTTGAWHEQAHWSVDNKFERHLMSAQARHKQFDLMGGFNDGKIYIRDPKYKDDNGRPIHRLRTTAHQTNELKLVGVPEFELHLESGKGLSTGNGSDPQIMMRYSHDGGYTWSHSMARSFGKIGEYDKRIRWNRLGTGREWIFEISIVEPVQFTIIDAFVMIEGGA